VEGDSFGVAHDSRGPERLHPLVCVRNRFDPFVALVSKCERLHTEASSGVVLDAATSV